MGKQLGRIAVVTGGTGDLGKIVVRRLLGDGIHVVATYSGSRNSKIIALRMKKQFYNLDLQKVDVESELSVRKFFIYLKKQYNRCDILCNLVGGVSQKNWIEDVTLDDFFSMLSVNLYSCFFMIRKAIPLMKRNKQGRIITVAGFPAIIPEAKRGGYAVAKSGVIALTKTVAEEAKQFGDITVNSLLPNTILTEKNKKWGSSVEFNKWITPDQIADVILYLCSDKSTGINGQIIQLTGKA